MPPIFFYNVSFDAPAQVFGVNYRLMPECLMCEVGAGGVTYI